MAIILAVIVAVCTLLLCLFMLFANGMSDAPSSQGISVLPTFIGGMVIAALLAGSHWLNIPW